MSLARARISMARPIMLRRQVADAAAAELRKGCSDTPAQYPVALEPPFVPLRTADDLHELGEQPPWHPEPPRATRPRQRIWIAPTQEVRWQMADSFLRQLQDLHHRVSFELAGNDSGASMAFSCDVDDQILLRTAFHSAFAACRLETVAADPWENLALVTWSQAHFLDFRAPTLYSKQWTAPPELAQSPLATVLQALSTFPQNALGLYQVVFQPVAPHHNWHRNIQAIYDLEFFSRFLNNQYPMLRSTQQSPSVDEKILASALNDKAHNDKNIFAVALRLLVIGDSHQSPELRHLQAPLPALPVEPAARTRGTNPP